MPIALHARASVALILVFLHAPAAFAAADVYVGTWGRLGEGRVYRYAGGTDWVEVSPAGGLGQRVWDLELFDGAVHAATQGDDGSGGVFRYDGAWMDVSPPGGFSSQVTTLSVLQGFLFATVRESGLYRYEGGTTWTHIGAFGPVERAIATECDSDHPQLHMGEGLEDMFWRYDPESYYPCDLTPCPPATGAICSGGCFGGSCIYAFAEHDGGSGGETFAGAYGGALYRFDPLSGSWLAVSAPTPYAVLALASFHGRLHVGDDNGALLQTSPPTFVYRFAEPVSALHSVASDDLLWIGHGGVPFGAANPFGTSMVRTWDGTSIVDRSLPDQFFRGVIAILAVEPGAGTCGEREVLLNCDAGPEVTVECDRAGALVQLDGSGTTVTPALPIVFTWEGPFTEGTADGMSPVVHFEDPGDHVVTLTVAAGGAEASCDTVVHVVDRLAPVLAGVPSDASVSCASVPLPPVVTAADACDGDVDAVFEEERQDGPCEDTYTLVRRWSARDAAGHLTEAVQLVDVSDRVAPVLAGVPPDVTAPCDAVPPPAAPTATDDCDPTPAVRFVETRVDGRCAGEYTLLRDWTATDRCSNASSARQVVTVVDREPPVVVASSGGSHCLWPPSHWHVCFGTDDFHPAVSDACSEPVTWRFAGCASDQPDDGLGDGAFGDDCVVAPDGSSACVRAERQGLEGDRHYAVSIVASDACGNESAPVVIGAVRVPHDRSAHDSFLPTPHVGVRPSQRLPF